MTGVPFDRALASLYLQAMYAGQPGLLNICYIPEKDGPLLPGEFFPTAASDLDAAAEFAAGLAREGAYAIYRRTTMLKGRPATGRGRDEDTLGSAYGFADLDFGHAGHKGDLLPPDAVSAKALVPEAKLPEPTLWIFSGGGWYPEWLWSRPLPLAVAKELNERIQNLLLLASKAHGWTYGPVADTPRVLRLPGSANMKTGTARMCVIEGGAGRPVPPESIPAAPPIEELRKADPRVVPPPRKSTAPYDPNGPKGPLDVLDELLDWPEILATYGLNNYVRSDSFGAQYVRKGASSSFSVKVMHDSNSLVNFSDALSDLPLKTGLSKAAFIAYMEGYGGNRSELLSDIMAGDATAGLPARVIDAMKAVGRQVTVIKLPRGQNPTPEQLMSNAQIEWVDEAEIITDTDVDDFLNTFIRYDRPRTLQNRTTWMCKDGAQGLQRHAYALVAEAVNGWYPAAEAIRTILTGCRIYGVDPDTTVKAALGALLNSKVSA